MDKKTFFEQYNARTHTYGRIGLVIGILMMVGCPFVMGLALNAMPNISAFWKGFAQVAAVYIPSCAVEFLIYTPMLGVGGSYLSFLTGNVTNMRIPCAMNAASIAGTEPGTAEHETGGSSNGAFICFAPANDPQIAVALYGERIAHPTNIAGVAEAIMKAYFTATTASEVPAYENQVT